MRPIPIEPAELTADESARWRPWNVTSGDPEVRDLPAAVAADGRVWSRWEFTQAERLAIANGAPLNLVMHTYGEPVQPVALDVRTHVLFVEGPLGDRWISPSAPRLIAVDSKTGHTWEYTRSADTPLVWVGRDVSEEWAQRDAEGFKPIERRVLRSTNDDPDLAVVAHARSGRALTVEWELRDGDGANGVSLNTGEARHLLEIIQEWLPPEGQRVSDAEGENGAD